MKRRILALLAIGITLLFCLSGCGGHDKKVDSGTIPEKLYAAKNPYIENTEANNSLVRLLKVNDNGKYTLEIESEDHPYTLNIRFMYLLDNVGLEEIEGVMTSNGIILMSLIGDCEQVDWSYPTDDGLVKGTIGLDYANEMIGKDIKKVGENEESFTALYNDLFKDQEVKTDDEK